MGERAPSRRFAVVDEPPAVPRPRGRRASFLPFAVLVYLVVATIIYRAWWSTLTGANPALKTDARAAEARIRYDHYTWLGFQYYEKHDYRNAERAFEQSVRYGPDRALAYNNLGSALNAQSRWDDAIAALEHSLALDPGLAIARNNLAWAREQRGAHGR